MRRLGCKETRTWCIRSGSPLLLFTGAAGLGTGAAAANAAATAALAAAVATAAPAVCCCVSILKMHSRTSSRFYFPARYLWSIHAHSHRITFLVQKHAPSRIK